MNKGAIIAAVILIVVGLLLFAGALIVSRFDFGKFGKGAYQTNTHTVREAFSKIEIRVDTAEIVLKPSESGECTVVCTEREHAVHSVSVEGETLTVRGEDKRAWYEFLTFSKDTPSVTLYLPSDAYDQLTVAGETGNVSVPGTFSFGNVDIHMSTGNVTVDASSEGAAKIRTSTGDIRMTGARAKDVSLTVSTGAVQVKDLTCEGGVSVDVSTGKAKLEDVSCHHLNSGGSTGDLSLKNVIATEGFSIERSTGEVRFDNCDAGQITVKTSTGDVTGTLRSGKVFVTKTSTGKITVPDTAEGGRCEISTSTGDIQIAVSGG